MADSKHSVHEDAQGDDVNSSLPRDSERFIDPEEIKEGYVVVPIIPAPDVLIQQPPFAKGSFGHIYLAKARGREVVVKVLDGIEWSGNIMKDFIKEISIMSQILHPNVVLLMGAILDSENFNKAIVMEYMSRGSLYQVLRDKKTEIHLSRKLQFAMDICTGMAWLHGQGIWHRDLKPENVLVDENWTCKVSDFGLSQVQRGKQRIRDTSSAPGSVLYMAPEVLLKKELTSKLDVYSFGLVLWEVLTQGELFEGYKSRDVFTQDIAVKGKRPPLKDIPHQILREILTSCWHADPEKRPSFEELIELLQEAILDIFLPRTLCTKAGTFWASNWPGKSRVRSDVFCARLSEFLMYNIVQLNNTNNNKKNGSHKNNSNNNGNADNNIENPITETEKLCLEVLIGEATGSEIHISIEKFAKILKWFGPMFSVVSEGAPRKNSSENKKVLGISFLERMTGAMAQSWFFGPLDTIEAQKLVELHKGTFLVRLNIGSSVAIEEAPFTISTVNEDGISFHTRIWTRKNGQGYNLALNKAGRTITVSSFTLRLEEFIQQVQQQEPFFISTRASPGWPYTAVFQRKNKPMKSPYDSDGVVANYLANKIKETSLTTTTTTASTTTSTVTTTTTVTEIMCPQPAQKNLPPGTRACYWCGKPVYHAEEQLYDGQIYHIMCMHKYIKWATEEDFKRRNVTYASRADVQPQYYRAPVEVEGIAARMESGAEYKKETGTTTTTTNS